MTPIQKMCFFFVFINGTEPFVRQSDSYLTDLFNFLVNKK